MKTGYLDIQKTDVKEIIWRAAFVRRHQYLFYDKAPFCYWG